MIAFMLGAATIEDGADSWVSHSRPLSTAMRHPGRRVRVLDGARRGSGLDATYPYFHWVFPSTVWQIGDNTFEEGPRSRRSTASRRPTETGAKVPTETVRRTVRTSARAGSGQRQMLCRAQSAQQQAVTAVS